ncbi:microviridin/marinostatin family tricyclic proteinase inhibitor [Phormidium tenue FACHB-886]|nr:microviridin/marinostatin family tricyclic proteinase inhibitor [Phormidium tenue FACHB-886]
MSEINVNDLNSPAVPFFARYLEGQSVADLSNEEIDAVRGGLKAITMAYPSDQEGDLGVTKRYPSDLGDIAITHKYPSDGDDDIQYLAAPKL